MKWDGGYYFEKSLHKHAIFFIQKQTFTNFDEILQLRHSMSDIISPFHNLAKTSAKGAQCGYTGIVNDIYSKVDPNFSR